MKLVIAEKGNAAENIAKELGHNVKKDKVYNTPICRFMRGGEEWVAIGLRGHILAVDFPRELHWTSESGWFGVDEDGAVIPAEIPSTLAHPPFEKPRKPFTKEGVDLKGWKVPSLPYLAWAPVEKVPAEKEIIRSLKNLAKKADSIIIATDFDREGELIGSDAVSMVREVNEDAPITRARYSSFTKAELEHAFAPENLVAVDNDLAAAGESRQFIDLIWGAVLTRYLTMAKYGGLGNVRSAGRVQTPTLALVAQREKERQAFVPEDYWVIKASMSAPDGISFKANHATARFKVEQEANKAYSAAQNASTGTVTDVSKKTRKGPIQTPFNTTSLQTAAAAEGLSPARTMRIAESLYMDGLISYPRVDNTVYPETLDLAETVKVLTAVPQYEPYCRKLLANQPLHATRGKQETTDHPPIYPTGAANPDKLRPEEWKLYNLIARRFLATLSEQPVIEGTKVSIDVGGEPFVASGDVLVKPGYREIYPYGSKKDEELPALSVGDTVDVSKVELEAKQTEPPARYSQGKLVQEMERLGLGTKSTRASIIERLYEVKYLKNDPIEPSQLGMAIIDALEQYAALTPRSAYAPSAGTTCWSSSPQRPDPALSAVRPGQNVTSPTRFPRERSSPWKSPAPCAGARRSRSSPSRPSPTRCALIPPVRPTRSPTWWWAYARPAPLRARRACWWPIEASAPSNALSAVPTMRNAEQATLSLSAVSLRPRGRRALTAGLRLSR